MGQYVTERGFQRKTLQEIRTELELGLRSVFGPKFETSVDSPNGLLISQLSLSLDKLWQLAAEVYASRDPGQAEGVALDWSAVLTGIDRKPETSCRVRATLYTDGAEAVIPAGSVAQRSRGSLDFTLLSDVSIDRTACDELVVVDDGSQLSTEYTFHFTFGDITLNNESLESNIARLMHIVNQSGVATADFMPGRSDAIYIRQGSGPVGIAAPLPQDFAFRPGSDGVFEAAPGRQTCEAGELDTIPEAVDGWVAVYNREAGVPGTDLETDDELRVRRAASRSVRACGTDPAIEARLKAEVPGVMDAYVQSNRAMTADPVTGRPPKSFEALVIGGDDDAVARKIYETQPSGIQSYGDREVVVVDSRGDEQVIRFSRPAAKYLWLKVNYSIYSEEQVSSNAEIRDALMSWAATEYGLGRDVIPDRIYRGLYTGTTGIGQAEILVAVTNTPDGTPVYGSGVIRIGHAEYASLAAERITLTRSN